MGGGNIHTIRMTAKAPAVPWTTPLICRPHHPQGPCSDGEGSGLCVSTCTSVPLCVHVLGVCMYACISAVGMSV